MFESYIYINKFAFVMAINRIYKSEKIEYL